jgi:hypothetical protein
VAAACHDAEFARRNKIDQKTACEFTHEDQKSGFLSKAMKEIRAPQRQALKLMNFQSPYLKGTRPTLSNLRRLTRIKRVLADQRPAYVPPVLCLNENGKMFILHPTKGWRSA